MYSQQKDKQKFHNWEYIVGNVKRQKDEKEN